MSDYTPALVRSLVDDLDAVLRKAVEDGKLKEALTTEKGRLNTIMGAVRGCRDIPALQEEFAVPRYLWELTRGWLQVKHEKVHQVSFFLKQKEAIQDFDRRHPDHHRPLVTGKRPSFLPRPEPLGVIQAKGSKPAPALAPSPIQPPLNNPPAPSGTRVPTPPPVAGPSSRAAPPPKSPPAPSANDDHAPQPPAKSLQVPVKSKKGKAKTPAAKRKGKGIEGVPVRAVKGKGKAKEIEKPVGDMEVDEDPAPAPALVGDMEVDEIPAPAPMGKGKEKEVIPVADSEVEVPELVVPKPVVPVPVTDEELVEVLAPARIDKGKGKERVVDTDESEYEYRGDLAPAKDKSTEGPAPAYQAPKVRPPPKSTGLRKEPPCQRCEKRNRICYAQAGFTQACVGCAKIKMRCVPVDKDERGPASTPVMPVVPEKRPAPPANAGPSKKKKPAPVPSQPVASGSKAKKVKSREFVEMSDDETELDSVSRIKLLEEEVASLLESRKNMNESIKSCTSLIRFFKDKMVQMEVKVAKQQDEIRRLDRRVHNAGRILEDLMDVVKDDSDEGAKAGPSTAPEDVIDVDALSRPAPPVPAPGEQLPSPPSHRPTTPPLNTSVLAEQVLPSASAPASPAPAEQEASPALAEPVIQQMSETPAPAPVQEREPEVAEEMEVDGPVSVPPASSDTPAVAVEGLASALEAMNVDGPASEEPAIVDAGPSTSNDMPPPPPPTSQIPEVHLLPPTPNTSQEAANASPITLLQVPVASSPPADPLPSNTQRRKSRSRSPAPQSPAPEPSGLRRSPRLMSPAPASGSKRVASEPLEEPAHKKVREGD